MSIGAEAIAESSVAAQATQAQTTKRPPPKRTFVATSDVVAQPEPR